MDFALESLRKLSYCALIGGYKHLFIDIETRKYTDNAKFEDLVALYFFDENLRGLFFKYSCRVERRIRSLISYHFTEKHGEQQEAYLNPSNYSNVPKYTADIAKLIRLLTNMANKNRDHEYIVYQRNKYHNDKIYESLNTFPKCVCTWWKTFFISDAY